MAVTCASSQMQRSNLHSVSVRVEKLWYVDIMIWSSGFLARNFRIVSGFVVSSKFMLVSSSSIFCMSEPISRMLELVYFAYSLKFWVSRYRVGTRTRFFLCLDMILYDMYVFPDPHARTAVHFLASLNPFRIFLVASFWCWKGVGCSCFEMVF